MRDRVVAERIAPLDRLDRGVAATLVRQWPDMLLLLNPMRDVWQVYETTRRSDWTVHRLRQAIITEYEAAVLNDPIHYPRTFWWHWRGAPVLVDDLPRPPGEWMLDWIKQRDLPAKAFLRALDVHREQRQQRARRERGHVFHQTAIDAHRHMRDMIRGDPLAGKRKWLITKEREISSPSVRTSS